MEKGFNLTRKNIDLFDEFTHDKKTVTLDGKTYEIFISPSPIVANSRLVVGFTGYNLETDTALPEVYVSIIDLMKYQLSELIDIVKAKITDNYNASKPKPEEKIDDKNPGANLKFYG